MNTLLEYTDYIKFKSYIKESLDNILAKNSTYDEFAKLAKNSHSINLIKIAEDCSYNTALPYNR